MESLFNGSIVGNDLKKKNKLRFVFLFVLVCNLVSDVYGQNLEISTNAYVGISYSNLDF